MFGHKTYQKYAEYMYNVLQKWQFIVTVHILCMCFVYFVAKYMALRAVHASKPKRSVLNATLAHK
ncbi:hypothetical protein K503DRAFT_767757 [Rhizopogon vinicolor AM-OR11-026]|uniref:Uncharacterized protein n=1 Tax=Rhizopogon vinicolor AM-OR11-026 TaxID=1314800 RepID=A0A1B7N922_9AGAM|nr:hypothetical protein K503DRAFT_767757 [Rhizopogon vinicolor AM-OR11-026]